MDELLPEIAAQRAQNWLYFGLLSEILGVMYKTDALILKCRSENRFYINTRGLKETLLSWAAFVFKKDRGSPEPLNTFENFDQIFKEANIHCELLDRSQPQCEYISCATKVLIRTIQDVIFGFDSRKKPSSLQFDVAPPRIVISRMVNAGWCPHQIHLLFPWHTGRMMYYLSGLSRQKMNVSHRSCSANSCIAHNVNLASYKVQHTDEGCDCRLVGPDIREVIDIIQNGHIPLMSLMVNPDGEPHLDVISADQSVAYTAMSHVWSGGLGNQVSNELPRCQIVRIYHYLNDLDKFRSNQSSLVSWFQRLKIPFIKKGVSVAPSGAPEWVRSEIRERRLIDGFRYYISHRPYRVNFWMDTLCIPVGEANASLRTRSIQNMDLIYAGARCSLVLDPELQQTSMKNLPREQVNALVMCSAWMTRCWTLQEARLSSEWYAQFADGLFDPNRARSQAQLLSLEAKRNGLYEDNVALLSESTWWSISMKSVRRPAPFASKEEYHFPIDVEILTDAWNNLSIRSTSISEDLLGILANMIHRRADEVVALPKDQRMKALFRAHKVIPTDILYNWAPKISDPDNRWIPLSVEGGPLPGLYGEIKFVKNAMMFEDFKAQPAGFLMAASAPRRSKFRIIDSSTSEVLWIRLVDDGMDMDFACSSSIATCYIMGNLRESTRDRLNGRSWHGARFSVQKEEGRALYLKYEYSLLYSHRKPLGREETESDYPFMEGQRTPPDQIFFLDCGE